MHVRCAKCKHVVLPNQSKKYGQILGVKSKTDKIDARVLSQIKLKLWQPVSVHFLKLKQLTRERDAIIRQRTTVSNQLHAYRVLRTQYKYKHQGKSNSKSIRRAEENIDFLNVQIAEIEKELKALVKADKALEERLGYHWGLKCNRRFYIRRRQEISCSIIKAFFPKHRFHPADAPLPKNQDLLLPFACFVWFVQLFFRYPCGSYI